MALILFGASFLISLVREQVIGQAPVPSGAQQVVVKPPAEPPRWLVDFTLIDDPANPARKLKVITIVDPESKRIVVYHQDLSRGTVKWMSTRPIHQDIWVDEFNAVQPTPREVEESIRNLRK